MALNKRNLKKIAIRSILVLQATGFFYDSISTYAWSYPVKEVTKPTMDCKAQHWSKLSADCKMQLPVIENADYNSYKNNETMKLIYSVLRGAPYSDGWDMKAGTHEGIDIVSSEGTPVYAIEDGEVIKARAAVGYGNVVTIKHKLDTGKVVYSIYGHLETVTAKEGTTIKEGTKIGTVGHEGMAWGNHLHFAINTTKDNTYAFQGCANYPKVGDYEIVEKGLCRDTLTARTVDPIAFIEANGGLITGPVLTTSKPSLLEIAKKNTTNLVALAPIPETVVKPVTTPASTIPTNTTATSITTKPISIPTPTPTNISSSNVSSSEGFLKNNKITLSSNFGSSLKKGASSTIMIKIVSNDGKKFSGVLDKELVITPTKTNVELSPRVIRYISDGQIISFIEAKEAGTTELVVSYGNTVIGKLTVTVN